MQDAGWNQVQDELLALDINGVSGVVTALIARNCREVRRQHVDDLALAFVAPLRPEHCDVRLRHSGISYSTVTAMILLDGRSLTLDDLGAIAYERAPVSLTSEARARVTAARGVVDTFARGDQPAYGINTGFGSFAEVRIPAESLAELQVNLVRSHAAGVGDPLPIPVVRATMALRANVLAKGFSGIRLETLDALIDLLNHGVHPVVPSRGSVGASGDLAPLAHLALVLIGEGEAFDLEQR